MQFTTANLPSTITTVESLAAWALSALYTGHGADRVLEVDNLPPTPAVEWTLVNAPGGTLRAIGRFSVEVDKAILVDTSAKPWTRVKAFNGNLPLPPGFSA